MSTVGSKKGVLKRKKVLIKSDPWQSTFRLHKNDHSDFMAKLMKEPYKTSIQTFIEACVYSYLDGDEALINIIRSYTSTSMAKKKELDWSVREQKRLLDDIAQIMDGPQDSIDDDEEDDDDDDGTMDDR